MATKKKTSTKKNIRKQAKRGVKMGAKRATKKVARKATKKLAKKATKKVAKKATKKVVRKATKKVVRKATKKVAGKATKKVAKKATKKVAGKATKKATKRATKKVAKKATKKVAKKATKKVVKKATKKVAKKATKKVAKKATKKVAKKATKKVAKKATKKVVKKATKKVAKKATKKVAKKATKKATKKVAKKATKKSVKRLAKSDRLQEKIAPSKGGDNRGMVLQKNKGADTEEDLGVELSSIPKRSKPAAAQKVSAIKKKKAIFKMTPFIEKQHKRLLDLRDQFINAIQGISKDTIRSYDSAENSATGIHQADAGSDAYDRDYALSILAKEQDALYEIERAIHRIETNSYGICQMSGEQIPLIRLEVLPFARLTVECQSLWESKFGKKRYTIREGAAFTNL